MKGKIAGAPERKEDSSKQKRIAGKRERHLERERDGKSFGASSIRLLDAG